MVPGEYDNTRGWQQTLNGLPDNPSAVPATLAHKSRSLAYLLAGPTGYVVQSRALDSGRLAWSSKPWNPPTPDGSTGDSDEETEVPDLFTATEDGREYVVAWGHGMTGKDELHDGQEAVELSVFPSGSSGEAITPERKITVPVGLGLGDELEVRDGGQGVLITWGNQAAAVNIHTGEVTPYKNADELLKQCGDNACVNSKVQALTSAGPVVGLDEEGFGVPGGWLSKDHQPKGAASGELLAATDKHLLASWKGDDSDPVFAVHDPETGAIQARTTCTKDGYSQNNAYGLDYGDKAPTPPLSASPNGRYLVAGAVAFDLKEKSGVCLTGDGDRKKLLVVSVRDDGTAYGGTVPEHADEEQATAVAVSLASGRPKALGKGTQVPLVASRGAGVFLTGTESDGLAVAVVRER
ncbi:hypothetical protein ABZ820_33965 [Streptomyces diacarni]|uniref:hypothetical protein n=1 Tax=Streptomyces diacarni TaxID=2800381 RepID=UPI0033F52B89